MTGVLEPLGWSYPLLLAIWIPTTFVACMLTALIIGKLSDLDLSKDPVYKERLKKGLVKAPVGAQNMKLPEGAKLSVLFFCLGVLFVVLYATAISKIGGEPVLIANVIVPRDAAIMSAMLTIATLIVIFCKVDASKIPETSSVFKSGMVACVCVFGVAWLGNTFVEGHTESIKNLAADLVTSYPALLAVVFFFASTLLYSQAATAKAIVPVVIVALGISPENAGNAYILVASFAAVSALFVLPTYPTLLGAVQMDDTGSTRIGKYIFNHAFLVPGVLAIVLSVALGFLAVSFI